MKTTNLKIIEKIPLNARATKYTVASNSKNGIGIHVNIAVNRRNIFLPQTSESDPIKGADRKLKNPFTPMMTPFINNA